MCSFAALAKFVSVFLTGFVGLADDTAPTKGLAGGIVREIQQHFEPSFHHGSNP